MHSRYLPNVDDCKWLRGMGGASLGCGWVLTIALRDVLVRCSSYRYRFHTKEIFFVLSNSRGQAHRVHMGCQVWGEVGPVSMGNRNGQIACGVGAITLRSSYKQMRCSWVTDFGF